VLSECVVGGVHEAGESAPHLKAISPQTGVRSHFGYITPDWWSISIYSPQTAPRHCLHGKRDPMHTKLVLLLAAIALAAIAPTAHADNCVPGVAIDPNPCRDVPVPPIVGVEVLHIVSIHTCPPNTGICGFVCLSDPMWGPYPVWPDTGNTIGVGVSTNGDLVDGYYGYTGLYVNKDGKC